MAIKERYLTHMSILVTVEHESYFRNINVRCDANDGLERHLAEVYIVRPLIEILETSFSIRSKSPERIESLKDTLIGTNKVLIESLVDEYSTIPLSDMPLYMNHSSAMYVEAAKWRLTNGV